MPMRTEKVVRNYGNRYSNRIFIINLGVRSLYGDVL